MTVRTLLTLLVHKHRPDLSLHQCELVAMQAVSLSFPGRTRLLDSHLTVEQEAHLSNVFTKQFKNKAACKNALANVISRN